MEKLVMINKLAIFMVVTALAAIGSNTVASADEDLFGLDDGMVEITTVGDDLGNATNSTAIAIPRNDLRYAHNLQLQALNANRPVLLKNMRVEIRGRKITMPASGKINLAPYLSTGRNVVNISAVAPTTQSTISLELKGKNSQISQQTMGSGTLSMQLTIDVL
jgi:hypothetical protein